MSKLTIVHEIRFSAEATVLIERILASLAALLQPPTPPRLAVQTEAPGVSAPPPICVTPSPRAEGPSRAARGTHAGRSKKTPRVSFAGWLTPERQAILTQYWPTVTGVEAIVAMLEKTDGPPLPPNPNKLVGQRAFLLELKRPPGFMATVAKANAAVGRAAFLAKHPPSTPQTVVPAPAAIPADPEPVPEPPAQVAAEAPIVALPPSPPVSAPEPEMPAPVAAETQIVARPAAPPIQAASLAPRPPIVPIDRTEIMRRIAAIKPAAVDPGKPQGEPIVASQETIRNWAMTRGLDMGRNFDIDVVNRKAAGIGHPGFILRTRLG